VTEEKPLVTEEKPLVTEEKPLVTAWMSMPITPLTALMSEDIKTDLTQWSVGCTTRSALTLSAHFR
jgi:hypothetical protein